MESSQEEIFSEAVTPNNSIGHENEDSVRLSRFTIYHSAPDFEEAMAEETSLFADKLERNCTSPEVIFQFFKNN